MLSSLLLQDKAGMLAIYAMINVVVFICGVFVMLMQAGFMMLETGSLSRKNAVNNIFKNFVDLSVCGVAYYLVGYAIFTGQSPVVDLMREFGLARGGDAPEPELIGVSESIRLFFNFAFAATSVTICSGAVTGRMSPHAYLLFGAVYSAVIYPVATFTVWNPHGLLYGVYGDFAGSMVVHGLGGFAGLAGALLLGPRIGEHGYGREQLSPARFQEASRSNGLHNMPLVALGVVMLWLGWYGFMAGSSFANGYDVSGIDLTSVKARTAFAETVFNDMIHEFGTVVLNATMAPCAAVLATLGFFMLTGNKYNMSDILNGALAGLVAITASADIAGPGEALMIGVAAGVVYVLFVILMYRLRIDDPVMAFPVHGAVGLAGVMLRVVALEEGSAETLANQALYGLGIAAYSFFSALILFIAIRVFLRIFKALIGSKHRDYGDFRTNNLRVTPDQELAGLDRELHGQESYNFFDADGTAPRE